MDFIKITTGLWKALLIKWEHKPQSRRRYLQLSYWKRTWMQNMSNTLINSNKETNPIKQMAIRFEQIFMKEDVRMQMDTLKCAWHLQSLKDMQIRTSLRHCYIQIRHTTPFEIDWPDQVLAKIWSNLNTHSLLVRKWFSHVGKQLISFFFKIILFPYFWLCWVFTSAWTFV